MSFEQNAKVQRCLVAVHIDIVHGNVCLKAKDNKLRFTESYWLFLIFEARKTYTCHAMFLRSVAKMALTSGAYWLTVLYRNGQCVLQNFFVLVGSGCSFLIKI